jgi:hypothetical protein
MYTALKPRFRRVASAGHSRAFRGNSRQTESMGGEPAIDWRIINLANDLPRLAEVRSARLSHHKVSANARNA